jgi:uncharacterized protein (TIGR02270 family)
VTSVHSAGLIWDIQLQHLDEAEFLLELWSNANDSPRFNFAKLRDGPEQRLLAHLDGLLGGGALVLERLLLPVLDAPDEDEFRTAAAALTILRGAGLDACERVLLAFDRAGARGRRALELALQLSSRDGLIPWLARDLDRLSGAQLASRLRVLTGHRVEAGPHLLGWLGTEQLEIRRAAAELARHTGAPESLHRLHPLVAAPDPELRGAAIESGIIRGQLPAWHAAGREAFVDVNPRTQRQALAWVAMLGDDAVHQRLFAALSNTPTSALLWAAGLSGRARAVDLAMQLLDDPRLARPAGELVCAVAGLDRDGDRHWLDRGVRIGEDADDALPALAHDDLDTAPIPSNEDKLRRPNPDEVRSWWTQQRPRFDPRRRYLDGQLLDLPSLARGLNTQPTRRRHALALELSARSCGRAQISTTSFTTVQSAQAHAVFSRIAALDFSRGLPL